MNYTPAPWKVISSPHGKLYICVQIGKDESYTTMEMLPADAKLVAAAPDLLYALQTVLAGLENGCVKAKPLISFDETAESADLQSLQSIVSAAIAKATK